MDSNRRLSLSSAVDRRGSTRQSVRRSINHDDSDDEYDLAAMGVSDGFRPMSDGPGVGMGMGMGSGMGMGMATMNPSRMSTRSRMSQVESSASARRSTPPPRPSSITKPRNVESFSLRHDGAMGSSTMGPAGAAASAAGLLSRSSSMSTESPLMTPESPYQGPSAPSHPYQMYPQDARLARTASVATTSTYQPAAERQYNGPGGPTHPYGMYPQNTVEEIEDPILPAAILPIGFPGRPNEYQRRLGPDGEEAADIIGPDGHTEQLPPYTQYPEEAFSRKAGVVPPVIAIGAGGIGLATRNPEFASREELTNPFESPVDRLTTSHSDLPTDMSGAPLSEKPAEKTWKTIAKRKVCGIVPIWVLVIIGVTILSFTIIVAAAVAVVKSKGKGGPSPPPPRPTTTDEVFATTVTTTYDATPLAVAPSSLPSLPVGTWGLNIAGAQTQSSTCIGNTALYQAWGCAIPLNMLRMNVQEIPKPNGVVVNSISIFQANFTFPSGRSLPQYMYGTQPPSFKESQVMDWVVDANSKAFGPAWFFQKPYTKFVIVPPQALSVPTANAKREAQPQSWSRGNYNAFSSDPSRKSSQPDIGDKPWFCYWDYTLLEVFIYPNASSSNTASTTVSDGSSATTTSPPSAETSSSTASPFQPLPPYPKMVKVEERRLKNSPAQPYCIQMLIDATGTASPFIDPGTGTNVTIMLDETESESQTVLQRSGRSNERLMERADAANSCSCVWLAS